MKNLIYLLLSLLLIGSVSCKYEFPEPMTNYSPGEVNLSRFICLGDDFSAGVMDGALYTNGQNNSFPAILSVNLELAGLESFVQPSILSENGYNIIASDSQKTYGRWIYTLSSFTPEKPVRVLTNGTPPGSENLPLLGSGNFSVPGLRIFQVNTPTLNDNVYYKRFASNPGHSTLLIDAVNQTPTFFTFWMGINDFMDYAINGGMGREDPPANPTLMLKEDLTPVDLFTSMVDSVLSVLITQTEGVGLVGELPDFSDFPYFYSYPYNFIRLNGTSLSIARTFYSSFNQAVTAHNSTHPNGQRPYIDFNDNGSTLYPQPVIVEDPELPDAFYPDGITPLPKYRQLKEGELVLMNIPVENVEFGLGWTKPLQEKYYLNLNQIELLHARILAFNTILKEAVNKYPERLVFVSLAEDIHNISETGKLNAWGQPNSTEIITFKGVPLEGNLELNSIFSLDGIHFNQRGNAYIANLFILSMNQAFHSNLPPIDANMYPGNIISN